MIARTALSILNGALGWTAGTFIAAAALFSGYSLWDNAQIYQAANDVQSQIQSLKPDENAEGGPTFEELLAVNKDVAAWITVDGTKIDYPVLQGENNLTYMNRDVYGEFSLAGSIFLDTRNSADFSDKYSLIYGHNMDEHMMFGDLAQFTDQQFFEKNTTAKLLIPGESRDLKVAAVLQVSAGTEEIFNPETWKSSLNGLGAYLEQNSLWYHSGYISVLKNFPDNYQVTTLVTCSGGSTNNRTVLVLLSEISDDEDDDDKDDDDKDDDGKDDDGKDDDDDVNDEDVNGDDTGTGSKESDPLDPDNPSGTGSTSDSDDPSDPDTTVDPDGSSNKDKTSDPDDPDGSGDKDKSGDGDDSDGSSGQGGSSDQDGSSDSGDGDDSDGSLNHAGSVEKGNQADQGLIKTGDRQSKKMWIGLIIGMLVIIVLYECWDRRMDRDME